jgi:hypothetical protein
MFALQIIAFNEDFCSFQGSGQRRDKNNVDLLGWQSCLTCLLNPFMAQRAVYYFWVQLHLFFALLFLETFAWIILCKPIEL